VVVADTAEADAQAVAVRGAVFEREPGEGETGQQEHRQCEHQKAHADVPEADVASELLEELAFLPVHLLLLMDLPARADSAPTLPRTPTRLPRWAGRMPA
jgi:hypothetical protein